MRGPQQLCNGESGNATSTSPVVQQSRSEQVLAYALDDNALGLGRSGHTGSLVVEGIGHAIRLRPAMRGCRAEHVVQRCKTATSTMPEPSIELSKPALDALTARVDEAVG